MNPVVAAACTLIAANIVAVVVVLRHAGPDVRRYAAVMVAAVIGVTAGPVTLAATDGSPATSKPAFQKPPTEVSFEDMTAWCEKAEALHCGLEFFDDVATSEGAAVALAKVLALREADDRFVPDCHHALHAVGQRAFDQLGVDGGLDLATKSCHAGYIHGVLQSWALDAPEDVVFADPSAPCADIALHSDDDMLVLCGHGIGHAVALKIPADLIAAAAMCENSKLTDVRSACLEGVMMEYGGLDIATTDMKEGLGINPRETVTEAQFMGLCRSVNPTHAELCGSRVFQYFPSDWPDTARYEQRCADVGDPARPGIEQACISSYGDVVRSLAGDVDPESDPKLLIEGAAPCEQMSTDARQNECYAVYVRTLWRDTPMENAPPSFCPSFPANRQEACAEGEQLALHDRRLA